MYDQTQWIWLAGLTSEQLGTGIYLVPSGTPDSPAIFPPPPFPPPSFLHPVHYQKVHEPNITYDTCKQNACAAKAIAFRWVPETIASYATIMQTHCVTLACRDTCVIPGCICNPNKGECE